MAQYDADSAQACTTWLAERPSYALVSRLHGYLLAAQERGSVDVLGKEKSRYAFPVTFRRRFNHSCRVSFFNVKLLRFLSWLFLSLLQ